MADVQKDIVLRVKAESEQATGQFKNLKQELRSIEGELNRMAESGDTGSKAFKELQQRAGQVKDQLGDTKSAIKALSSDTFKLDAFAQGAQAIAGGFASAQGAMALFGSENQQVEEAIKKTQGAMALLQGVTSITNILQKESALRLAITTTAQGAYTAVVGASTGAMKLFRLALASTGIGALVVGLGLLISNFDDVKKVVMNLLKPFDGIIAKVRDFLHTISFGLIDDASTAKTKDNAEQVVDSFNKTKDAMKENEKVIERQIELAKAQGKSTKEIYNLEKQLADLRVKNLKAEQTALQTKVKAGNATEDEKKRIKELTTEIADANNKRLLLDASYQKSVDDANKKAKEKRDEDAKKAKEKKDKDDADLKKKQEQDAKDLEERRKKEFEDSIKANEAHFAHLIAQAQLNDQETETLEIEKLEKQLEIEKKYGNDTTALTDQIALKKKGIKDKEAKEIRELEDKERGLSLDADKRYLDASLESTRLSLEKKKELLKESYLNGIISEKEYQDKIAQLDTKAFQVKQANINKWGKLTIDGLSALTELNNAFSKKDEASQRKAFERNKKFSIAQALISTFLAVNGALTAGGNPVKLATGAQFVEAGIALTMGLAQVAKISKTQFSGGGQNSGGGGGGLGTIPTPSTQATQTSGLDSTQLQLDAQGNLMQQRTMRTYVLETDISAKQQRSKRLQQTATLGK
jgi:hypothetical protein